LEKYFEEFKLKKSIAGDQNFFLGRGEGGLVHQLKLARSVNPKITVFFAPWFRHSFCIK